MIGHPATAPIISRQPVPELPKSSALAGCAEAGHSDAINVPDAFANAHDPRAECAQHFAGIDDVFAFQQARNPGPPDGQARQDQGAVGD